MLSISSFHSVNALDAGNDPEEEAQRAPGDYQIQNPFPTDDNRTVF